MQNRGVHSPNFLGSLAIFFGMISSLDIEKILINDMQTARWKSLSKNEGLDEISKVRIQQNITNKTMKTFLRLANEFEGLKIAAFPNEIDNYMHLKMKQKLTSKNSILEEFYRLGYFYQENMKNNYLDDDLVRKLKTDKILSE